MEGSGASDGAGAAVVQSGTVKTWSDIHGCGSIVPTEGDGPEVFVERSALTDGESLTVGTLVTFEVGINPVTGRPFASICVGANQKPSAGDGSLGTQGADQQLSLMHNAGGPAMGGQSNDWSGSAPQSEAAPGGGACFGYGGQSQQQQEVSDNLFISGFPPESTDESIRSILAPYGSIVSIKCLPPMAGKPDRAALVRMGDITQAKWLVENLHQNIPVGLTTPISVRYSQGGGARPAGGMGMGMQQSWQPQQQQDWGGGAPAGAGSTLTGTVKAWMEERGMGFITASSGEDFFVHRSELMDGQTLVKGSPVQFESGWDHAKGKTVARSVYGAMPQPGSNPPAWAAQSGGGKGQGGMVTFGDKVAAWQGPEFAMSCTPKEGTVKVWFDEKGFGFLAPDDNSGDAFVHRTVIQDANQQLVKGQRVSYTVDWDWNKNRHIARWCSIIGDASAAPAVDESNMQTGSVKVWFEEKGYGFIQLADGSGDVFAHRSNLVDGSMLTQGAPVRFIPEWSWEKNKTVATRVMGASTPGQEPAGGVMAAAAQQPQQPQEEVIIGGLPSTTTIESIKGIFGPYGSIMNCSLMPASAGSSGISARMKMANPAQAQWLVTNLNGNMPVGLESPISVTFSKAGGAAGNRFAPY